ncbi:hypothetical protein PCE1_000035 [Barthelona sp. PCE]
MFKNCHIACGPYNGLFRVKTTCSEAGNSRKYDVITYATNHKAHNCPQGITYLKRDIDDESLFEVVQLEDIVDFFDGNYSISSRNNFKTLGYSNLVSSSKHSTMWNDPDNEFINLINSGIVFNGGLEIQFTKEIGVTKFIFHTSMTVTQLMTTHWDVNKERVMLEQFDLLMDRTFVIYFDVIPVNINLKCTLNSKFIPITFRSNLKYTGDVSTTVLTEVYADYRHGSRFISSVSSVLQKHSVDTKALSTRVEAEFNVTTEYIFAVVLKQQELFSFTTANILHYHILANTVLCPDDNIQNNLKWQSFATFTVPNQVIVTSTSNYLTLPFAPSSAYFSSKIAYDMVLGCLNSVDYLSQQRILEHWEKDSNLVAFVPNVTLSSIVQEGSLVYITMHCSNTPKVVRTPYVTVTELGRLATFDHQFVFPFSASMACSISVSVDSFTGRRDLTTWNIRPVSEFKLAKSNITSLCRIGTNSACFDFLLVHPLASNRWFHVHFPLFFTLRTSLSLSSGAYILPKINVRKVRKEAQIDADYINLMGHVDLIPGADCVYPDSARCIRIPLDFSSSNDIDLSVIDNYFIAEITRIKHSESLDMGYQLFVKRSTQREWISLGKYVSNDVQTSFFVGSPFHSDSVSIMVENALTRKEICRMVITTDQTNSNIEAACQSTTGLRFHITLQLKNSTEVGTVTFYSSEALIQDTKISRFCQRFWSCSCAFFLNKYSINDFTVKYSTDFVIDSHRIARMDLEQETETVIYIGSQFFSFTENILIKVNGDDNADAIPLITVFCNKNFTGSSDVGYVELSTKNTDVQIVLSTLERSFFGSLLIYPIHNVRHADVIQPFIYPIILRFPVLHYYYISISTTENAMAELYRVGSLRDSFVPFDAFVVNNPVHFQLDNDNQIFLQLSTNYPSLFLTLRYGQTMKPGRLYRAQEHWNSTYFILEHSANKNNKFFASWDLAVSTAYYICNDTRSVLVTGISTLPACENDVILYMPEVIRGNIVFGHFVEPLVNSTGLYMAGGLLLVNDKDISSSDIFTISSRYVPEVIHTNGHTSQCVRLSEAEDGMVTSKCVLFQRSQAVIIQTTSTGLVFLEKSEFKSLSNYIPAYYTQTESWNQGTKFAVKLPPNYVMHPDFLSSFFYVNITCDSSLAFGSLAESGIDTVYIFLVSGSVSKNERCFFTLPYSSTTFPNAEVTVEFVHINQKQWIDWVYTSILVVAVFFGALLITLQITQKEDRDDIGDPYLYQLFIHQVQTDLL